MAQPKGKARGASKVKGPRGRGKTDSRTPEPDSGLFVVGIGASAGGLEALRPLVSNLPALSNMAYVVVQHLSPQYRSMLGQILGRDTQLEIVEITDGVAIERNRIYITPPDKDVVIKDLHLHLRKPAAAVGPKPSVDAFLVSLAEDRKEYAIGVILSGTGTDGAHGMRAVKAHSGFTIVQDPDTTKYDGMPKAAIQTGCVDRLMPPDKIGQELESIAQFPRLVAQKSAEEAEHGTLDEILIALRRRTDVDFSQYKHSTLCRRLERRLAANRMEDLETYLGYIREKPQELDFLCKDILISVTSFFRDAEAFRDLADMFGEVIGGKAPGDSIRLWIPGCATGEEAYSLAMMVCDHLGHATKEYPIQIFATDLDMDAMAHARKGLYSEETVRGLDAAYIDKYFDRMGQTYQVKKAIREMVVFARQDLTKDPPFVRVDLISCRNVLIYFNPDLQERIMGVFHYALNPGGYLFLGKSESIGGHTEMFKPVRKSAKVFVKRNSPETKAGSLFGMFRPKFSPETPHTEHLPRKKSVVDLMNEAFVEGYAPDSVVVNDDLDVMHFHENVETFMHLPKGSPNLNLSKLIIDDFRPDLRVLLSRVQKERGAVYGLKKRLMVSGEPVLARLVVRQLVARGGANVYGGEDALYLVSCETEPDPKAQETDTDRAPAYDEDAEARIAELEQELIATQENLQTVVEELETSNEELQALNEELQAANEELQSSNEELETSNEELQSTNEELTTVNEELNVRSNELSALNTDLENIQENIGFPMLVVDKSLRVTRFSPYAVKLFDIRHSDLGQLITAVPTHTEIRDLRQRLNEVILSGRDAEDEIRTEGVIYRMRVVPYRDANGNIDGAILTFFDETEMRLANERIQAQEEWTRFVTDSVPALIYYIDDAQKLRFTNRPAADFFGTSVQAAQGKKLSQVVGTKNFKQIKPHLDAAWQGKAKRFEIQDRDEQGNVAFLQVQFEPQVETDGRVSGIFAIVSDVSALKKTEAQLMAAKEEAERANQAKSNFLASMSHELRTPLNAIMAFSEMIRLEKFGEHASPKYREYADDIYHSGRHLTDMICEILDLSKVEANMVELDDKPLDVGEVITSARRIVADQAAKAEVELHVDVANDLPCLMADETMLKRVIINLVSNAVKFTPEGGQVSIGAQCDGGEFDITVTDTGIGIPPQDLDRVFMPFEQVKGSIHHAGHNDGVGLGLSITRSLVELHGGTIDLTSNLGKGTAVTVSFPRDRVVQD